MNPGFREPMQAAHPREPAPQGQGGSFTQADVETHPLFVLVRNAMIEAALTGIVPPEVIVEQLTPVPGDLLERYSTTAHSSELDEAMLKLLRLQQSFIQEHKDVNRLCEDAVASSFQAISRLTRVDEPGVVPTPTNQDTTGSRLGPFRQMAPALVSPLAGQYYPPKQDGSRQAGSKRGFPLYQYYPHNSEIPVTQVCSDGPPLKRKRSCGLDQSGTDILRSWIIRNWKNPYPSEATKTNLVMATGFTRVQVNNWFINARRRLIKKQTPEALQRMAEELEAQEALVENNGEDPAAQGARQGTVTPAAVFRGSDSDDEAELTQAPVQPWYGPNQRPRRERDFERLDGVASHMYPRVALELPNILSFGSSHTTSWAPPPLPLMGGALADVRQHEGNDSPLPTRLPVPDPLVARRDKDPV